MRHRARARRAALPAAVDGGKPHPHMAAMTPLSVLDLSPIVEGSDAAQSLRNSLDLARHAERWGYRRYWLAEHHNMPGIASAATAVVIGHVAAGTSTIRVGAGGIMLPNHAPLVIAEQFGTLAALYPGRIDLGLGRAPGTDQVTARALRRNLAGRRRRLSAGRDRADGLLPPARARPARCAPCRAPASTCRSGSWARACYGAQLAAALGLPYAFASHFAPAEMDAGDGALPRPLPALAAARRALRHAGPQRLRGRDRRGGAAAVQLARSRPSSICRTGRRGPLPPPVEDFERAARSASADDPAAGAELRGGRLARDRQARARGLHRATPAPTRSW